MREKILKQLQQDLPITSAPFHELAKNIGISEDELLTQIQDLQNQGVIRKLNAVIRHRVVGYQANALCVWKVDTDQLETIGNLFAALTEVTHCYERETYPEWQYNLYTMVHAKTRAECEKIIQEMSRLSQVTDYQVFYSTKELKKTSMRYYR
jgi:DNA-binding Lrp family transcriptional regulator